MERSLDFCQAKHSLHAKLRARWFHKSCPECALAGMLTAETECLFSKCESAERPPGVSSHTFCIQTGRLSPGGLGAEAAFATVWPVRRWWRLGGLWATTACSYPQHPGLQGRADTQGEPPGLPRRSFLPIPLGCTSTFCAPAPGPGSGCRVRAAGAHMVGSGWLLWGTTQSWVSVDKGEPARGTGALGTSVASARVS